MFPSKAPRYAPARQKLALAVLISLCTACGSIKTSSTPQLGLPPSITGSAPQEKSALEHASYPLAATTHDLNQTKILHSGAPPPVPIKTGDSPPQPPTSSDSKKQETEINTQTPQGSTMNNSNNPVAAVANPSTPPAIKDRLVPVDVLVNETPSGQWVLLERNGNLYASLEAIKEWRLLTDANMQIIQARNKKWLPLAAMPGFQSRFNEAEQSMSLTFAPNAFVQTIIANELEAPIIVTPAATAGFMNYDVSVFNTKVQSSPYTQDVGGLVELGFAGKWGVITSSYVGQNLLNHSASENRHVRRLETVLNKDFISTNTTVRIGDSTTRAGAFNTSLNFGGIQVARNFSLRPGFVTQPIPAITGTSNTSSTVDLYINEVLRQTSRVPAGPFTITNFPLITDNGEARIVVKDALGRDTVITQPFFTNANLLEKGLSDWSVEAGLIRYNLGTDNANYGPFFASGLWRHGVSKSLTVQGEAKWSATRQRLASVVNAALPFQTLGTLELAYSHDRLEKQGRKWAFGIEKTTQQQNFGVRIEGATRPYRELGWDPTTLANQLQISANYSYSSLRFGTATVGYARVKTFDQGHVTTLSASYTIKVGQRGTLTFTATRASGSAIGQNSGNYIGVSFFLPLEKGTTFSAGASRSGDQTSTYAGASRPLMTETGTSWRALAGTRDGLPYSEGGLYYQGDKGLITADASASGTQTALRLGAQGGAIVMGSHFFATRRIDNSFALVEVPGYPNVTVGYQGKRSIKTNKDGIALLTGLQPYQTNRIQLAASDLPLNAELDNIEQIAIPPAKSGIKIAFPVRTGRAALLQINFEDGQPAPAGAPIELVGDKKEFFVARRGQAFVTGLQEKNTVRLKWKEHSCDMEVILPTSNTEAFARLKPVTCLGVTR